MSENDLSTLTRVVLDQGKAQWLEGKVTGIDKADPTRTHTVGIPHLMPATIIFVHGVNSDGEWYENAAAQFAAGLRKRLGRNDLEQLDKEDDSDTRFKRGSGSKRYRSPIIPFYWGYSVPKAERQKILGTDELRDRYGNPLRKDGTWGGGPFQNGTSDLLAFWHAQGFSKHIMGGLINVDAINPVIGRSLNDCPNRLYYVHAARRLANLVKTIREDLPNEPINIVAHSQGTMIALCSLFYMEGVRGPDTVILNSSPYRFDTKITDFLATAAGQRNVQSEEARIKTFAYAAGILQKAKDDFQYRPAPDAECAYQPVHRHKYDDQIFVHQSPGNPNWQAEIGVAEVDEAGRKWWQASKHSRDNRGKLFVNFNPGDRVIGVSAVGGMGWRGIPPQYFGRVGGNVMQRMYARGSNAENNPPVGLKTDYRQSYFYTQIARTNVKSNADGVTWTTGSGLPLQVEDASWHYLDGGDPTRQWYIPSEKILRLMPVLGSVSPVGDGGLSEYVTINAPQVPNPAELGSDFDLGAVLYDGESGVDQSNNPIQANKEQRADFVDDVDHQERRQVTVKDDSGLPVTRWETWEEVEKRRREEVGSLVVPQTNHAQILRYRNLDTNTSPVAQVLSYDLTVGPGYAWGDEAYWNYLLDLADWKKSDPYYQSGKLNEALGDVPPGIDRTTVAQADDAIPSPARAGQLESIGR